MKRRRKLSRAELIAEKRRLEGEINAARAEVRHRRATGQDPGIAERRLARLRDDLYRTRLEIDRTAG